MLPVLNIIHTYNPGAAWSFLADAGGWQRWVFSALAIGVSVVLVVWLRRLALATQSLLACGLALILGGAIGNVIDRLRLGHVVDFVQVHWGQAYFPGVQRRRLRPSAIGAALRDPRRAARSAARATAQARSGIRRQMKILLANPRGFCAGVDRAIDIVERAIAMFGAPIYVRHEVVHNVHVVERLRKLGAVFVDELDQVPDGATVIFSAHGVPAAVENEAARRGLTVFDATCPLVTKVHMEVARYAREGRDVVLIGHAGHPEVEGTMGRFDTGHGGHMHLIENVEQAAEARRCAIPTRLAFVTQTTLSVDDTAAIVNALRERFPDARQPAPRRHLLRHAEPPGCGEGADRELRRAHRRRFDHQLEFQPAARARRARRAARLSHRRCVIPASANGSKARTRWASPPAPRRPRSWCSRWSRGCASGAARRPRNSRAAKSTWCSRCRARCGRRNSPAMPRAGVQLAQRSAPAVARCDRCRRYLRARRIPI